MEDVRIAQKSRWYDRLVVVPATTGFQVVEFNSNRLALGIYLTSSVNVWISKSQPTAASQGMQTNIASQVPKYSYGIDGAMVFGPFFAWVAAQQTLYIQECILES